MTDAHVFAAGRALWARIAGRGDADGGATPDALAALVRRLALITAPSLAHWLLGDAAPGAIAAEDVEKSRQLNRYLLAGAARWLAVIAGASIPVVALKGLATAHRFYPDPLIRGMGDVDLLVREAELSALVKVLGGRGFRFRRAAGTPRWGLISDASFHPFVAPDGGLAVDLHVEPDDAPVHASLDCEDVFARARPVDFAGGELLVPADDHLVLLAVTNAARDKFGPLSLRSMLDLAVATGRAGAAPDWRALARLADAGGYGGSLRAALALLAALGIAPDGVPPELCRAPGGLAGRAFAGIVADYLTLFADPPSKLAMQFRDAALISSRSTVVRRNLRRLPGLVRPWPGIPEAGREFRD